MKNIKQLAQFAQFASGGNKHLPILKSIYFDGYYAHATDLEAWVSVEFHTDKEYLIPASAILAALKISKTLKIENNMVNDCNFNQDHDIIDFPRTPKLDNAPSYSGILPELTDLISHASHKCIRYYLMGILFSPATGSLVATDGHRALIQNHIPKQDAEESILPIKTAELCNKFKAGNFYIHKTHFSFTFPEGKIVSAKIDGKFPDWQRVIPADTEQKTTFTPTFLQSLKRAQAILKAEKKYSSVCLDFKQNLVRIPNTNMSMPLGNNCNFDGEASFNPNYLLDACEAMPGAEWQFNAITKIAKVKQDNKTCVIMGVR